MKKIINLTKNAEGFMLKVIELFRDNEDVLKLYRGEEHYTVKYNFPDGNAEIDIDVLEHFYLFNVHPVNSALLVTKSKIPTFEVGLALSKTHQLQWHRTPYQKDARDWLKKKVFNWQGETSNADYLLVFATVCQMVWSFLLPCMKMREYGDVIEYAPRDDFDSFADEWVKAIRVKYKEEHRLDGWDVVSLTQKQLTKLGETLEEHHIHHDFDNIALHRFCLVLYDGKNTQYFFANQTTNNIHFEVEDDRSSATAYCDIGYEKTDNGELYLTLKDDTNALTWLTQTSSSPECEDVTHWQWMVDMFFSINSFMLHFGDVTMEVETKEAHEPIGNRAQRRQSRNNMPCMGCKRAF